MAEDEKSLVFHILTTKMKRIDSEHRYAIKIGRNGCVGIIEKIHPIKFPPLPPPQPPPSGQELVTNQTKREKDPPSAAQHEKKRQAARERQRRFRQNQKKLQLAIAKPIDNHRKNDEKPAAAAVRAEHIKMRRAERRRERWLNDEAFRVKIKERNARARRERRKDVAYRAAERERDKEAKRVKRKIEREVEAYLKNLEDAVHL